MKEVKKKSIEETEDSELEQPNNETLALKNEMNDLRVSLKDHNGKMGNQLQKCEEERDRLNDDNRMHQNSGGASNETSSIEGMGEQPRIRMGNLWFQQDPNDPQKWIFMNVEPSVQVGKND